MAEGPEPCVYCGAAAGVEGEHVLPRSWYPDTTPPTVQRLKVPSCGACNDKWARVEESLGQEFILVISPEAPEVAGVHQRLTRAWQADRARGPRDLHHRIGRALKIQRTMAWVPAVPGQPQVPGRTAAGLHVMLSPARSIEPPLLRGICEKFIRGIHYAETGQRYGTLGVQAFILNEQRRAAMRDLEAHLATLPIDQRLGPGLWYRRLHGTDISAWAFLLWGQITLFALAKPS